jgi:hypothetical protein
MSWLVRPVHPGLSQVLRASILADTMDQRFDARPLLGYAGVDLITLEDWVAQRVGPSVNAG